MLAHRYALPALSGILLALVFFPFYVWPLAFIALAPLFYFSAQEGRTGREAFIGGVVTGIVGIGPLVYLSLAQLMLFPDAAAFTFFIRASSIPAALLIGCLFGLVAMGYRALSARARILSCVIAAALYLLVVEAPLFWVFGGYYYGALSHAVASFPPALAAASLGGAALVSFLVALTNGAFAGVLSVRAQAFSWVLVVLVIMGWGGLFVAYKQSVLPAGEETAEVAVIQGGFEEHIGAASGADLVVFPFTPLAKGIVSLDEDAEQGEALARIVPENVTVLLWQTLAEGGALYDEYVLWQGGERSAYRKRELYSLSDDYTPAWLRALGIEKSPYGITPGAPDNAASFRGSPVGALICSEVHQTELARRTAAHVPFIVAAGSDTMFPGPLSGDFSLAAARLRAAENAVPVVRGNLQGPSAVINPDGSVQAQLAYGEEGVLRGAVPLAAHDATPYAKTGSAPVFVLSLVCVATAAVRRYWISERATDVSGEAR